MLFSFNYIHVSDTEAGWHQIYINALLQVLMKNWRLAGNLIGSPPNRLAAFRITWKSMARVEPHL